MKERICAGFKFKASGINCTFQMAKESVAIAKLFAECRDIMISRCRRKQSEFFCEKGKVNRRGLLVAMKGSKKGKREAVQIG